MALSRILHPFVRRWMDQNNLEESNTHTEYGLVAQKKICCNIHDVEFIFTKENKEEQLERLNCVYGLKLTEEIFKVKVLSGGEPRFTLEEISEMTLSAAKFRGRKEASIYMGGVTIPNKDFLYLEFDALSPDPIAGPQQVHRFGGLQIKPYQTTLNLLRPSEGY